MLINYIITALRSMRHNKSATLISVAGLSIGVSCALMIFLYIQYELSIVNQDASRFRKSVLLSVKGGTYGQFSGNARSFATELIYMGL